MISILLTAALAAAPAPVSQAAMSSSRQALVACLKDASSTAKPGEVTLETFPAFAKTHCAAQVAALQDAMVSFDMKNGIKRKDAVEGADLAIDDYVASAKENFEVRTRH
jgi:hypothetical protein